MTQRAAHGVWLVKKLWDNSKRDFYSQISDKEEKQIVSLDLPISEKVIMDHGDLY